MSVTETYPLPYHVNDIEPWCVEDNDGGHVAECDSPQAAAFFVQLANAYWKVRERGKEVAEKYDRSPALAHHPGGAL